MYLLSEVVFNSGCYLWHYYFDTFGCEEVPHITGTIYYTGCLVCIVILTVLLYEHK